MSSNPGPQSGVNAWLEEELLQQYRHDRSSVDKDWKAVFDSDALPNEASRRNGSGGNGAQPNGTYSNGPYSTGAPNALSLIAPSLAEPVLSGSEELMPLRGAPAGIAENMAASVTV